MIGLIDPFLPYIAAFFGAVIWGLYQRREGSKSAEMKRKAKERDSYEEHLREISGAHDARSRAGSVQPDDPHRRD